MKPLRTYQSANYVKNLTRQLSPIANGQQRLNDLNSPSLQIKNYSFRQQEEQNNKNSQFFTREINSSPFLNEQTLKKLYQLKQQNSQSQNIPDMLDIHKTKQLRERQIKLNQIIQQTIQLLFQHHRLNKKQEKIQSQLQFNEINQPNTPNLSEIQQFASQVKQQNTQVQNNIFQRLTFIFNEMNEIKSQIETTISFLNYGSLSRAQYQNIQSAKSINQDPTNKLNQNQKQISSNMTEFNPSQILRTPVKPIISQKSQYQSSSAHHQEINNHQDESYSQNHQNISIEQKFRHHHDYQSQMDIQSQSQPI